MTHAVWKLAGVTAFAIVAAGPAPSAAAEEDCKNHYILTTPSTCKWVRSGDVRLPRFGHTATLLRDGSVLVVGGMFARMRDAGGATVPHPHAVERFDPATGSWRVAAPSRWPRAWHTATLLEDGRVLVAGGEAYMPPNARPEIYDPVADRWEATAALIEPHERGAAVSTLLADGRVLLTGGVDMSDITAPTELFDPRTNLWTLGPALITNRFGHVTAPLPGGRILLVGGYEDSFYRARVPAASTEIYEPESGSFRVAAPPLFARYGATATVLPDANILVSGGVDVSLPAQGGQWNNPAFASTEVYDVRAQRWVRGHDMRSARHAHTVTVLEGGALLIAGGRMSLAQGTAVHAGTELVPEPHAPSVAAASLNEARSFHTATRLLDGSVLVVGGRGAGDKALRSTERFGVSATR